MASQEMVMGPYRLVERIGVGGMGMVYRAQHQRIGREAAIKVLPSNLALEGDFLKRFEREASSIASLEHPNILPVWEYGDEGGIPYLVMPLIRGGTLKDRLQQGPLTLQQAAQFLRQMAEALDYAHDKGIIHRDVKPANMLLNERGHLYLADFGIAKALQGGEGLTRTGVGVGTPEYMAPEQAQGKADKRSDLYALTVILYQMITGKVPYSGNSVIDTLMKHINEPLPLGPLRAITPPLPPAIEGILWTGTAKNPDDRHQSGQELADAFAAAIAGGAATHLPLQGAGGAQATGHTPPPGGYTPPPGGYTPPPGYTSPRGQTPPPGYYQPPAGGTPPPPGYPPSSATPPPGYAQSTVIGASYPATPAVAPPPPVAPPAATGKRPTAIIGAIVGVLLLIAVIGGAALALRGGGGTPPTATTQPVAVVPTVASAAPTAASAPPTVAAALPPTVAPTAAGVAPTVASAAPTARPTTAPTQPPPTLTPLPSSPPGGYRQDFAALGNRESSPTGQWKREFNAASGEYRVTVFNGIGFKVPIENVNFENFVLEVDIRKIEGPEDGGYGLVFRSQPKGASDKANAEYFLFIQANGSFALFQTAADGTDQQLESSLPSDDKSPAIKGGEGTNRVTIRGEGETITVAVNGQPIGSYKGTLTRTGQIGLLVLPGADKATTGVAFSNLRVQTVR